MRFRISVVMAASLIFCPGTTLRAQKPPQMQPPVIRVGEDGVFVRVLVTDTLNRYIAGLAREHFRVYENGVRQTIHHFTQQSVPLSIGIVLDLTASMSIQADRVRWAISRLAQSGQAGDEYFVISFDEKGMWAQDAGGEAASQPHIAFSTRKSPLIEALTLGMERLKKGVNEKKAIIAITDREISSTHPAVQIFAISGMAPWNYYGTKAPAGAGTSGVRTFVSNISDVDYYIRLIQDELRNQYVLGYMPTDRNRDGKWRKIEVKLNPPKNLPKMTVIAGKGYAAPK